MTEVHPDHSEYLFWNIDHESLQGEHECTIDFTAWGKSRKAQGIHVFISVNDLKLHIFIKWWDWHTYSSVKHKNKRCFKAVFSNKVQILEVNLKKIS